MTETTQNETQNETAPAEQLEAEATEAPRVVKFGDETYTIAENQPTPKALTHLAKLMDTNSELHMVLYAEEVIGREQWGEWCNLHESTEIYDFSRALSVAIGGNR